MALNLFLNIHYGNFLFTLVGPIGTPSGNSGGLFRYYWNRKLRKEHMYVTTCGREKIECFGD